ncbi:MULTISPECIES: type 1 glutamine amidotransferase domain-containing protein [Elizabethkingia]|uniref:type 1 glutamine amidotransferase domain-containing protein n=1 Tax=Elizabethkingia TaxID=308865 RepID=UPI000999AD70|nr:MULTISPECIES: type 1 glutamine amidotransferase domain-containing protein [Elizabethkingia]AQX90572.1 glutamine amidotransferase [Elizabethkingia anophelis]EHM7981713.1 type 1 glutamine amidotransferase domain-containing protein [Elizabethkingia anophelis]EHM8032211.1 type 1 glutamine amidotransferase domain-containing protein [Elizabethkingia anophelis]EHZ9535165.1 type 1 glutamine amidotransferase domain-containing protein [Elizabethkingia anophelis]EKU3673075.1 type 1 glutamine amidotran
MNNVIRKHGQHSYPKKKILCLVSNTANLHGMEVGFFAEEMTRPFYDFIIAGYDVDVASPNGGAVKFDGHSNPENPQGAYPNDLISIGFVHHKEFGKWLQNTRAISEINVSDYDAVCVAGGGAPLLTFKDDAKLHKLIADFYEAGKITCLICHGTSLLLWTRLSDGTLLADGKTWTGFADSEEALINQMFGMTVNEYTIETEARKNPNTTFEVAGALEPFAVQDGRLITAQQQHSSYLASQLVIEALSE